jgi:hypothetical protein
MSELVWQKSSFSEGGADTCVELAVGPLGEVWLREGTDPHIALATTPARLRAFLGAIRGELRWQKSSFSEGGTENCVELAAGPPGEVWLREGQAPQIALTTSPRRLRGLLDAVRRGASVLV